MIAGPSRKASLVVPALRSWRAWLLLLAGGLALLVLAGCSEGSYPVDIFPMMHYQASYRANEPPRLSPPEASVPWFPVPVPIRSGAELFATNCSICHGANGWGDGDVLRIMESKYSYTPAVPTDLTSVLVKFYSDEQVFSIVTNGVFPESLGGVDLPVMPSFEKLLSEQERHLIIGHVRSLPDKNVVAPTTGEGLFVANCSICHGLGAKGDGSTLKSLEAGGYIPAVPTDLTSALVQGYSDDEIMFIISNGDLPESLGGIMLPIMPPWETILTEDERRLIIGHLRTLGAQ